MFLEIRLQSFYSIFFLIKELLKINLFELGNFYEQVELFTHFLKVLNVLMPHF